MDRLDDLSRDELKSMIKSQNSTIERLCEQLSKNVVSNSKTDNKLAEQLQIYKDITKDFNCKISATRIVIDFFKSVTKNREINCDPYVHGSFVRQLLEFPFNMNNLENSNPIGRDIDIILGVVNTDYAKKIMERFIKKFDKTNPNNLVLVDYKECTVPELVKKNSPFTHENYTYTPGIIGLQNIPHYKFTVDYFGYKIDFDIMASTPVYSSLWSPTDFDVNSLKLYNDGIKFTHNKSVKLFENIQKKVTKCIINIQKLHETAIETPEKYKSCMLQIGFYLTERLKIVEAGYTIKSDNYLPNIKVETNDKGECPYVLLADGSWISLIEFIKKITNDEPVVLDLKLKILNIDIKTKYISEENLKSIRDLIREKSDPIKIENKDFSYCY